MYTSVLLAAVVGLYPAAAEAEGPTWMNDYHQAQKQGRSARKPLAVFVGSGKAGYAKVCEEGKLSAEANRLLADKYVCVYLDTDTREGRRLAAALHVDEPTGLVVSDRTGKLQAFLYPGKLTDDELITSLKRFSNPNYVVRNTVTSPYESVSYYSAQQNNPAARPAPRPAYRPQPAFYPSMGFGGFGGFGGGGGGGC